MGQSARYVIVARLQDFPLRLPNGFFAACTQLWHDKTAARFLPPPWPPHRRTADANFFFATSLSIAHKSESLFVELASACPNIALADAKFCSQL